MKMIDSPYKNSYDQDSALALGLLVLLAVPALFYLFMRYNKLWLESKSFRARYDNIYSGLALMKSKFTILYMFAPYLRRIVFVLIPTLVPNFAVYQSQMFMFIQLFYTMIYCEMKPHQTRVRFWMEMFNETMICCCIYSLILFTAFVTNIEMTYVFGYGYIWFIATVIIVNVAIQVFVTIESCRKRRFNIAKMKGLLGQAKIASARRITAQFNARYGIEEDESEEESESLDISENSDDSRHTRKKKRARAKAAAAKAKAKATPKQKPKSRMVKQIFSKSGIVFWPAKNNLSVI